MLVLDNFILSLGFRSQDKYFPRDRKDYEFFHGMIDPTAIVLICIFTQIQMRADMTSRLIGPGLFSPVKAEVECCESCDLFRCRVTDCSATRIPSWRSAVGVFYIPSWLSDFELSFVRLTAFILSDILEETFPL